MKKQLLKKILVFTLMLALIAGVIPNITDTSAATKPSKPSISLKALSDGTGIKITIKKTKNADGYGISIKAPGEKEYVEVATLNKSGKKKRSTTIKNLSSGEYSVGVRAYKTSGKKKVWGKYGYKSITLVSSADTGKALSPEEQFKKDYPKLQALVDNGSIGLKIESKPVRDTIKLGSFNMLLSDYYEVYSDKKDDIEWEVLEYSADGKSAFVISKYVIDSRPYNKKDVSITWEKCSLRKWLNNDFINTAFSDSDRALIKTTTVKTTENPYRKGTTGGKDTKDKIFVLSYEEANKYYLPENADPEEYDEEELASRIGYLISGENVSWTLRTPGYDQNERMSVSYSGEIEPCKEVDYYFGIRPAFWIELTSELIKANNLSVGKDGPNTKDDIILTFGTYDYPDEEGETYGNPDNLEWYICDYDEKENKALLLSRYIVKDMKYLAGTSDNSWEKSDINRWLNTEFYNSAFSDDEAARIMINLINEPDIVNVKDKVFVLSKAEVEKYIKDYDIRIAGYTYGTVGDWWLRTPGENYYCVYSIYSTGNFEDLTDVTDTSGVRPAIYLNLDLEIKAEDLAPEAPVVKAVPTSDKTGIEITVDRNFDTDGYDIFLKKPGSDGSEKAASITEDGSECRSCTIRALDAGEYTVSAVAYRKYGNEKIAGPYGNEVKVVIDGFAEREHLELKYPELVKLFDKGIIGFNFEYERDSVKLGSWKDTALEWEVLEYSEDGKSALLLCKNLVEKRKYNSKDESVTWENCSLRKWLNGDFLKSAFSDDEKKLILKSTVINEDNEEMETDGGNDTEDQVFIPSYSEFKKYAEENIRGGYTGSSSVTYIGGDFGSYWLRTVGRDGEDTDFSDWDEEDWEDYEEEDYQEGYAVYVSKYDGRANLEGSGVAYASMGVRPMIRISLTDEIVAKNNLTVGNNKNLSQMYIVMGSQKNQQGSDSLEWEILEYDEKNNRALLINRYLISKNTYKDFEKYSDKNVATWADSSIREWLNKDFYASVFSKEEQALIEEVEIENPDNPKTKTKGGDNTFDKLFLLSIPEVQKYFGTEDLDKASTSRICTFRDGSAYEWWLRSPGSGKARKNSNSAAFVDKFGVALGNYYRIENTAGVRPVMWITLG